MFEFTTTWNYLVQGGLLLSHDMGRNSSFYDFAKKVNCRITEFYFTGLGGLIK